MTEMTGSEAAERVHRALAVPSRRRLMSLLREADGLLGVDELATATGLSVATVRHHLVALADAGLVRATAAAGPGRGRPKLRYTAVRATDAEAAGAGAGDSAYHDLAAALVEALAEQTAGGVKPAGGVTSVDHEKTASGVTPVDGEKTAARAAGRAWGRRLTRSGATGTAPAERVFAHAARMGFDPEQVPAPAGTARVLLHACPYRDLARRSPEVVCALHQGVLDGLLEDGDTRADLTPFVGPDLCRADLRRAPAAT
ncbi:ArsR family transcriptional regulator [Streptomyces monticola]|uniref:ArsR family transcriptional regulator n=1 Tax=Streptomyces monticola TaxID=2666263 RepID=A0ABW2JDP7_9ACTN